MSAIILIIALAIVIGILFALPKIRKTFVTMNQKDLAAQARGVAFLERRGYTSLYLALIFMVMFAGIAFGAFYIGFFASAGVAACWVGRFAYLAAHDFALWVLVARYNATNIAPASEFAAA